MRDIELEFRDEAVSSRSIATYAPQVAESAIDPDEAERRAPKYTFEDNFDKWSKAERPGSVFAEEGEP